MRMGGWEGGSITTGHKTIGITDTFIVLPTVWVDIYTYTHTHRYVSPCVCENLSNCQIVCFHMCSLLQVNCTSKKPLKVLVVYSNKSYSNSRYAFLGQAYLSICVLFYLKFGLILLQFFIFRPILLHYIQKFQLIVFVKSWGIKTHKYKSVIFQQDHEMLKASKRLFTCVSLKSPIQRIVHGIQVSFHISSKSSDLIHALTKHTFRCQALTNRNT